VIIISGIAILKQGQRKMIISDLVTDKEVQENSANQSVSRPINPSLLSSEIRTKSRRSGKPCSCSFRIDKRLNPKFKYYITIAN
jgi:hypothetical protein